MENHNSLMSALHAISPDDRDTWVQVGMALNAEFGDGGFEMWDSWSRRSDRYKESSTRAVWRSFKRSGIGIGSLYLLAQQAGWQGEIPPLPQARHSLDAARRQAERATPGAMARAASLTLASTHPAALAVHSGIVADTPRAEGSRGVPIASIFLTLALTN